MRGDAAPALGLALSPADTFWALGSLCNLNRVPFDAGLLARAYPPPHTLGTLLEALRSVGCEADLVLVRPAALGHLRLPAVVLLASSEAPTPCGHTAAVDARPALLVRVDDDRVLYFAAGVSTPSAAGRSEFEARYVGCALRVRPPVARPEAGETVVAERFGFRWFVPELAKHGTVWREVLAASLAIQLLALAMPLLSQVIIDKVIVHRATSTLAVIASALTLIVVFSSALTWIRQYLVVHTGNRVDAVLGAAVFRHLLALPLRYFGHRPTGVLTARLAGIEAVREFVCGAAITLALDIPFLLIFVGVMFAYSVPLTLLTLTAVGALAVVSVVAARILQRCLDAQFLAGARTQAFVTEHIAAIETVKALELEAQLASRHGGLLAEQLAAGFRTRQVGNGYQTFASAIEQLLSAAILCAGAWLVMTRTDFTLGMLVAFQMFAARVAQPLLRVAGLWQQFQQAAIAVRRLGDVMDVPVEPRALVAARVQSGVGRLEFDGVGFRYAADRPWLLRGFSATVEPGECVLVTGASGSGKSTLLKLLLAFALPVEGAVRVGGRDTRALAANELRGRFGVVPQETVLFSGTLLANLQLGNPMAGFDEIVRACRIAGIDEAIEALPEGYRTEVGERGFGLSGGQRQRLALARALLRRPQILLLDEPFSQLDDESCGRVAGAIARLKGTVTIVIVSHQRPPALAFDRTIVVRPPGTGVAGGTAA